jgi:ABC-type uncharacterized transport system substrate-binding protein
MIPWIRGVHVTLLGCAIAVFAPGPAMAHPHVFVDYRVTCVVVGDRLTGLRFAWTFDDLFSGFILNEFDKDRNGMFSAGEAQRVEKEHLSEFRRVAYYTTINVDGKPTVVADARDFRATVAKGLVTYEFTLPLAVSLGSTSTLEVWVDDPVYYISYAPVAVTPQTQTVGPYSVDCRVVPDKTGATPDLVRCGIRRR